MIKKIDSNQQYHSSKSISASGLKVIFQQSLFHYINYKPKKTTAAMNFGTAVHAVALGDTTEEIVVMPDINARTTAGKIEKHEFMKANEGKTIITQKEHEGLEIIMDNLNEHEEAKELIDNLTEVENSYYFEYYGVPVRIRPDGIKKDDYILDIKTTSNTNANSFRNDTYRYCYHLQAVFYSDSLGYDAENFKFIAIENKEPYSIEVYSLGEELIDRGRKAWQSAFKQYKEFYETGELIRKNTVL
tara:strand:- start:27 stop:761 length:735 start_codon:yes stop_codon:yes gene_type:complete